MNLALPSRSRSGLRLPASLLPVLLTAGSLAQQAYVADTRPALDPKIVRRSVEIDDKTTELARNYTYQQREVRKHLGRHGEVRSNKVKIWDIVNFYGEPYSHLIRRDDKPLSAKEEKEEEEKADKFLSKLKGESDEARQKRHAKERKEREEERAFIHEVVNAYTFQIVGQEVVNGRDAWVIEATPRHDFRPTQPHANILSKLQGKIWIDTHDYTWVKVQGEVVGTISLGLFLARIHEGSRFTFEQVRLNNEIWMMRRLHVDASARVLLLSNRAVDLDETFSNYQKFTTHTKILPGVREVQPQ